MRSTPQGGEKIESRRSISSQVISYCRCSLGYLVLPNLLFYIGSKFFDTLPRAAFNIDYLLVGALAPFVGAWGAVGLMSAAVLADTFRSSGSLYYFSQRDAFSALAFVGDLPPLRVARIAIVGLTVIVAWSVTLVSVGGCTNSSRKRTAWMLIAIVVLALAGVWGGNSSLRVSDHTASENLASSSGLSMLKTIYGAISRHHDRVPPTPIDSATRRAGWFEHQSVDRNLVLIVVESWGHGANPAWDAIVTAPLRTPAIQAQYSVSSGTVPFYGPTVPGEFRELCGLRSGAMERPTDDVRAMEKCLPSIYTRAGARATFIHSYDGHMFDRQSWVARLGFERSLFRRDLLQRGVKKCDGPFAGACDDDVVRFIGAELAAHSSERNFYYLLTVNSHLPIAKQSGPPDVNCEAGSTVVGDEASCELLSLIARVHRAVAEVASRPDLPQTEFLLVGDHAPPFLYKSRRDKFSQSEVPFIRLTPKSAKE